MDRFDYGILNDTAHRPWPLPRGPWVMTQTWHDLLFAHWTIDPALLRAHVPPEFPIDTYGGQAWLGIVPFHMSNVAPRGVPALPWVSAFAELNVRTYVRVGGRAGIYFFSLDAARALAVQAARFLLNLPYHTATMRVKVKGDLIEYESWRKAAVFTGTYEPCGGVFFAQPRSLEAFLTERYCFFHRDHRGRPYVLDIHHRPWPLQPARASLTRNTMAEINQLRCERMAPLVYFAKRQDVLAWLPSRL